MIRQPVQSSNLVSVGYDATTYTLEIEFRDGRVYQYFEVPCAMHEQLMAAPSTGEFFQRSIRGAFAYARL
jgi:hypothetical protein